MPTCTPVDLGGGTTPTNPCTTIGVDPFSVQWCTAYDVVRLSNVLITERNQLVRLINEYNRLVGEGRAKWEARTNLAWTLEEEALQLWRSTPKSWAGVAVTLNYTPAQAALQLAQMAQKVHAAACGVEEAILETGEKLPAPPVAPQEPDTIADYIKKETRKGVEAAGWILGAVVVGTLAYQWLQGRRR